MTTSGEATEPLALRDGEALPVAAPNGPPAFETPLRVGSRDLEHLAIADGVAYAPAGDRVEAIDLATGRTLWRSARGLRPQYPPIAVGKTVVFVADKTTGANTGKTVALRRADGRRSYVIAVRVAGVVNGFVYGKHEAAYVAADEPDGHEVWSTLGGVQAIQGARKLVGTVLLQQSFDSGAILVGSLYALDVRNGRARWARQSNRPPLGFAGGTVYLDSTWFPMQLDNYVPLSVSHVDIATGNVLSAQTHAPDPDRNARSPNENPGRAEAARVAGGYVYLRVRGMWYRYRADLALAAAHPSRLEGVDEILDWFEGGALLVAAHGVLAVARPVNDALVLHRFAGAAGIRRPGGGATERATSCRAARCTRPRPTAHEVGSSAASRARTSRGSSLGPIASR